MLSQSQRESVANALFQADQNRQVIVQPSITWPDMELEDAYAIQAIWARRRIDAGARIIGHKIGLTSRAMQKASNITEPDYGVMLDDALIRDGERIAADRFIRPRLEVELAFVMGSDLEGANCETHDVLRATEYVVPALEIIDYRTEVPRSITDTIADNAAFGAIVLGGRVFRPFDLNLRWIAATMIQNGIIEESGVSAAVMGHPASGIAWLVRKLHDVGSGLKAGHIVLSGSFTRPVDIAAGDICTADFGELGTVSVAFQ